MCVSTSYCVLFPVYSFVILVSRSFYLSGVSILCWFFFYLNVYLPLSYLLSVTDPSQYESTWKNWGFFFVYNFGTFSYVDWHSVFIFSPFFFSVHPEPHTTSLFVPFLYLGGSPSLFSLNFYLEGSLGHLSPILESLFRVKTWSSSIQ